MNILQNHFKKLSFSMLLSIFFFSPHSLWAKTQLTDPGLNPELRKKIFQAYRSKGDEYKPRTEHVNQEGRAKYVNRLILEESPYLIQHAHNPVNWYAWGKEAFETAKKENKPIFLSIGYSTCHWCHVMERESFDNERIARFLNEHFVSIKVDRERRPDVDKIYMTALMMVQGSGGWPMSSVLTPEGHPFFSGTYYPPELFMQLLERATELWQSEESKVREIAEKITSAVQSRQRGLKLAEHIGKERVQIAVITLLNRFDELQGGFSQAPKFPNEPFLFLLLDQVIREQDQEVLAALILTMDMMAQGGIYDQVGGGFHRYATDNEWLIPHFEKMLYNQAHLARNYLQLYSITKDIKYQRVVTQTLDYVIKEMQANEGGFYSATDADSEGEEGKFFLWSEKEINELLSPDLAKLAIALYGVTKEGNFTEHTLNESIESDKIGANILNLPQSIAEFSRSNNLDVTALYKEVDSIRSELYKERLLRIAPATDRKIVTAWNGMMITALSLAGKQLNRSDYISAADKAADYLWKTHFVTETGENKQSSRLFRSSLNGSASVSAIQSDYAYLIQGYLALYDVTHNKKWLQRSEQLVKEMIRLFWDKEEGAFYMTATVNKASGEVVLFDRPRDITDGAIPSGNAVALEVLSLLYNRTGNDYYHAKAMALVASLSSTVKNSPTAYAYFLMAVNQFNFGEVGSIQYGAKGHVKLELQKLSDEVIKAKQKIEMNLSITMDAGWHINSRYPLDKALIATSVSVDKRKEKPISESPLSKKEWTLARIEYPQGETIKLKFNDAPLSLYQNKVDIKFMLESDAKAVMDTEMKRVQQLPVSVTYQSCNDKICLAPQTNTFYVAF